MIGLVIVIILLLYQLNGSLSMKIETELSQIEARFEYFLFLKDWYREVKDK